MIMSMSMKKQPKMLQKLEPMKTRSTLKERLSQQILRLSTMRIVRLISTVMSLRKRRRKAIMMQMNMKKRKTSISSTPSGLACFNSQRSVTKLS